MLSKLLLFGDLKRAAFCNANFFMFMLISIQFEIFFIYIFRLKRVCPQKVLKKEEEVMKDSNSFKSVSHSSTCHRVTIHKFNVRFFFSHSHLNVLKIKWAYSSFIFILCLTFKLHLLRFIRESSRFIRLKMVLSRLANNNT